ncbi:MAG: hypothetical protein PWR27_556 [Petroclostridium sp.]|jgi:hypothetical protein|uniref:DUF362 domain-containing protein n=1 Tax=Petroclostridium xylanilyticum TaxID=1792311 RepID=UPI000B97EEB1|nr:DUF362 domain-containing protein [Petroclostridium xylanilyticum]MDK2809847.1 hypothetical protein [Petroclostridium sp.]
MNIPKMIKIKQYFNNEKLENVDQTVKEEIKHAGLQIKPGAKIAIAVGSRGIANLSIIVKALVESIKKIGGNPFIVPAMGSHGGATAEGQREVLESYGITEQYVGAPIKSSMEVMELPGDGLENKVYMDKYAYEADGTIVVNRIKVHTDFHGPTESGLFKMLVIGLGKHKQAIEIHRYGVYGLKELIPLTARQILKHGNIIMGLGIVENAYDETMIVKAIRPEVLEQEEIKLMDIARKNMPSLPVDRLDVLIVDTIGKDISGTGMDTNIVGRIKINTEQDPPKPKITRIVATDLSEGSHGNAVGMGIADVITERLRSKIDFRATYENVLTATFLERGKMPVVAQTDRQALEYAFKTCGPIEPEDAKVIRIKDTLHLGEMYVSQAVLNEIQHLPNIEVIGEFVDIINDRNELIKE